MFKNFPLGFFLNSQNESGKLFSHSGKEVFSTKDLYWLPELLNDVSLTGNEYSYEWREYLLMKNSEEIKQCRISKKRFTFYTPNIVKCVFDICKMLKQPPEVRYLAVDILDRFLAHHFFTVVQSYEKMDNQSSANWQLITERMLDQSLLRILTCIQLAVKCSWNYNMITATTVQKMMEVLGSSFLFPKKSIIKSEARVFQNLSYKIPDKTPLVYLEMFFDDFQQHGFFQMEVSLEKLFSTCVHVLDVATVNHERVYLNLLELLKCDLEENSDYFCSASIKADFVVLAASVIFASSVLLDPRMETSRTFLGNLSSIGNCKKYDIQVLGTQIINLVQYT